MPMRIKFLDTMSRQGSTFTFEDALRVSSASRETLWTVLSRLEKKGWIERIGKGKYMIIPLGAEKGKYTLHEFIIGSMLAEPYCISYWSALHHHGLTEQIPNTVFIQTTSRRKNQRQEIFGVDYRIVRVKEEKLFGVEKAWMDGTQIHITDREKTIIDCLDKPQYCGGVVEVAKALNNVKPDVKRLRSYAERIGNSAVLRRLGYLTDIIGIDLQLPKVETRNYLYLDPTMPKKGTKNARWRLIVNLDESILGELE